MPQPTSAPTNPAVTPPAPAPAIAAANGPATIIPNLGNARLLPISAIAAKVAPIALPTAPPSQHLQHFPYL